MKKLFSVLLLSAFVSHVFAQTDNFFPATGNVGIGTNNPDQKLTIKGGGIGFDNNSADKKLYSPLDGDLEWMTHTLAAGHGFAVSFQGDKKVYLNVAGNSYLNGGNVGIGTTAPQSILNIKKTDSGNDQVTIIRNSDSPNLDFYSAFNGQDDLQSGSFGYGVRPADDAWQIWSKKTSTGWDNLFSVNMNGNIGVGILTPNEKLAVNGKIRAKEVKVEATNWPDYVFEEGYNVETLAKLESYIKANKHLPDMPSAKEVEAKGLELGEMVKLQQQKIEELTLHLIEKDKQLNAQNEEVGKLKNELTQQAKILKEILEKLK